MNRQRFALHLALTVFFAAGALGSSGVAFFWPGMESTNSAGKHLPASATGAHTFTT